MRSTNHSIPLQTLDVVRSNLDELDKAAHNISRLRITDECDYATLEIVETLLFAIEANSNAILAIVSHLDTSVDKE